MAGIVLTELVLVAIFAQVKVHTVADQKRKEHRINGKLLKKDRDALGEAYAHLNRVPVSGSWEQKSHFTPKWVTCGVLGERREKPVFPLVGIFIFSFSIWCCLLNDDKSVHKSFYLIRFPERDARVGPGNANPTCTGS